LLKTGLLKSCDQEGFNTRIMSEKHSEDPNVSFFLQIDFLFVRMLKRATGRVSYPC